jgi:hypothetical protein
VRMIAHAAVERTTAPSSAARTCSIRTPCSMGSRTSRRRSFGGFQSWSELAAAHRREKRYFVPMGSASQRRFPSTNARATPRTIGVTRAIAGE